MVSETAQANSRAEAAGSADLLLTNGRIWTGLHDSPDRDARSIAIARGRIVGVGSDESLRRWCAPQTTVVDLGGRRTVPGLIDSHIHAVRAGLTYSGELDWTEVRTLDAALASVRDAASRRCPGEWIVAMGGWTPSQFRDSPRMPTSAELSAAAPEHPVFVHPLYAHGDFAVLSSRAMDAMGWSDSATDPHGGVLGRDADGATDGTLMGVTAYQSVAQRAFGPESLHGAMESTGVFLSRLAALGLVGVIDAGGLGMSPDKYHAVRGLWREGALPVRVRINLCPVTRGNEPAEVAAWEDMLDPGTGDEMLAVLGVGEVLNYGVHDWEGMEPFPITDAAFDELVGSLEETARRRWPMTIHAVLDTSISRILDAIEIVARSAPIKDLRWNLCHAESISRRNLERMHRLGIALAVQGRLGQKARSAAERWGAEALTRATPFADIRKLGIPFGAGTDGTRSASYNPWQSLWWLVTGKSVDGGPVRERVHLLDRAEALHAYTGGSAWLSFEEDTRGSLAVGAWADITVLDADFFAVPEDDIPAISSELTLVAGRVVHRSAAFADLPIEHDAPKPGPRP